MGGGRWQKWLDQKRLTIARFSLINQNIRPRKQYSPAGAVGHGFPWASEGGAGAAGGGAGAWHGPKTPYFYTSLTFSS